MATAGAAPQFPSTVGRVLERTASRLPDKPGLTFQDRRWTYAELDRAVGRVAAQLLALGLAPGDRVAAFGKNSDAYVMLYLGCARAGLVHVPVNFNARGDELVYLLTQSEPEAAFSDPALHDAVVEVAARPGGLRSGTIRDGQSELDVLAWAFDDGAKVHAEQGVRDGDLAQLLYTSGTTSQAKGRCSPTGRSCTPISRRSSHSITPSATSRCTRCRCTTRGRCTCS